jgi:glucokinase
MYEQDPRIVMTLDAGGTNFVFSAMQGCREMVDPIHLPTAPDDLSHCLSTLVAGFLEVRKRLAGTPEAISFAFPGPADYAHGVIGDLPNFPAFRGGVALGPYLEAQFGIPTFINNDGNLFAYGEAIAGLLPRVNEELRAAGRTRRYRNLIGITLGTGFGAGVVVGNQLLTGDNGCGGDVWLMRNKKYPSLIAEESVSIRAVRRVYEERSGTDASALSPKDIFDIAEGTRAGDRPAAISSFRELGEVAADAIVRALDIVDGLVVIGGGVAGAAKYILPSLLEEARRTVGTFAGDTFPGLQMEVFDLTDPTRRAEFLSEEEAWVSLPRSERQVPYLRRKKTGIALSTLGTSRAIAIGAYAFALNELSQQ